MLLDKTIIYAGNHSRVGVREMERTVVYNGVKVAASQAVNRPRVLLVFVASEERKYVRQYEVAIRKSRQQFLITVTRDGRLIYSDDSPQASPPNIKVINHVEEAAASSCGEASEE